MATIKRNCDYCGVEYDADTRNLKRGWGLTCSKSCAAKKRAVEKTTLASIPQPDVKVPTPDVNVPANDAASITQGVNVSTPTPPPITDIPPVIPTSPWHESLAITPELDTFVLGHKKEWEDKVYNPSGVRMCYYDKDGYFTSAIWNRVRDMWDEVYGEPTHWMAVSELPKP